VIEHRKNRIFEWLHDLASRKKAFFKRNSHVPKRDWTIPSRFKNLLFATLYDLGTSLILHEISGFVSVTETMNPILQKMRCFVGSRETMKFDPSQNHDFVSVIETMKL
jgi:hypothetical protein